MRTRLVSVDELGLLKEIRLRALRDAPEAFGSTWGDEAQRDAERWLPWVTEGRTIIAEDDGGWHGLVAVFPSRDDASLCYLISMWVARAQQGRGVGRSLLVDAMQGGCDLGATAIQLGVVENNGAALRLYKRAGFQPTGESDSLRPGSRERVLLMTRPLVRDSLPGSDFASDDSDFIR